MVRSFLRHSNLRITLLFLFVSTWLFSTGASNALAQVSPVMRGSELVQTSILLDYAAIQPPRNERSPVARVGVRFVIEPDWHIYWKNPGEAALATDVKWNLPEGWSTSELRWPTPLRFIEKGDVVTFGYRDEVMLIADLYAPLVVGPDFQEGVVTIGANVSFLVCKSSCIPGEATLSTDVPFGASHALGPSGHYSMFERFDDLAPRDIGSLQRVKGFEQAELIPIRKQDSIATGHTVKAGLLLKNFSFATPAIHKELQLFSDPHEYFTIGRPSVIEAEKEAAVLFEIGVPNGSPIGENSVSGILVLSCAACGTERDISLPWSFSFNVSESETKDKGLNWKAAYDGKGEPLTFRSISLEEAEESSFTADTKGQTSLVVALIAAFFAGVILNVMPCVLPVLSLKIFGFVESAQSRAHAVKSALIFAFGILITFAVLASIVVVLKNLGTQVGWGFQFQHLGFVFFLTVIVFLFSLGFFELYTFNPPGLQIANRYANKHQGRLFLKHFSDGVLATLLSTPCTAPFLGTALAFAFSQSVAFTFAVFMAIGTGLATPYVLLASNDRLLKRLPRPGPWMDTFKKVLGFLLIATVIWLLHVMQSLHTFSVMPTIALLFVVFFLLWLKKELQQTHGIQKRARTIATLAFLLIALLSLQTYRWMNDSGTQSASPSDIVWRPYSAQEAQFELRRGNVVFIDFTADWCITCKFNERFVIDTSGVKESLKDYKVITFKADWTTRDAAISAALKRYGGQGVPHYVVLSPHREEAAVLPTLLTSSLLRDAFAKARQTEVTERH